MDAATAALITLITVSPNGEVHWERFQTQHMCEEAASIVLTGKTIETVKADAEAAEKAEKEYRAQWRKDHPCRPPKNKAERDWLKGGLNGIVGDYAAQGAWYYNSVENGQICSMPMTTTVGSMLVSTPQAKAVCVP